MKKILLSVAMMTASISALAQDIDNCYTMQVPALMSIMGQAPAQKAYVQVSSNFGGSMVKVITSSDAVGIAIFASMCTESRGDLTCAQPILGKGAVQYIKMQNVLNLKNVQLKLEKSDISTKILGSHSNLKLSPVDCRELINLVGGR
jgi:hypothetical protein